VRRMYAADAPVGAWERKRVRYPKRVSTRFPQRIVLLLNVLEVATR